MMGLYIKRLILKVVFDILSKVTLSGMIKSLVFNN